MKCLVKQTQGRTVARYCVHVARRAFIAGLVCASGWPVVHAFANDDAADTRHWRSKNALLVKRTWGVDIVGVHPVSSGQMLAFKYRIIDPDKARLLNERKVKAYLVDEASGTVLAVPAMENIGELRSGTKPQPDRIYFMIFGNPGQLVKAGSKVSVVAGGFKVEGLVVQ
jgi:hypothetical protein